MESTGGSSGTTVMAAAAMPSPSVAADNSKATNFEFDPSILEEERRFYLKAYPTVDVVRERKTHCTVCKIHIGTAPVQENGIKMHPILRVTHCNKCHDFYNSGEFSKGEDGSELYCRWCGQGGEVYCCSSCPYVFCKSCIVKNLSRGVVADIEQNENWNCFSCAPKILWPLRAQHWALMNYIEQQKKELYALNLSEAELKANLSKDRSKCCRLAKAKCGNMSDSMESLDSVASKRSHSNSFSIKKPVKHSATPSPQQMNAAKRAKSNDEVVCTPDLLSMLEPDCQITVPAKPNRPMGTPSASTPKVMSIQQPQTGYGSMTTASKNSGPPSLVLRNAPIKFRASAPPPVVRRTIIGPRTPNPGGNGTPVYHTINGYRIDLNTAAQQETFRLPNGKLIQVKRQGPPPLQNVSPSANNWQQMTTPQPQRVIPQTIASRAVQITQHPYNISVQQQQSQHPQVVRYHNNVIGSPAINSVTHNGTTIQVVNGQMSSAPHLTPQQSIQQTGPIRPVMVRHVFPENPIGQARSGLQDQVFNAMEICTHLTNKVQTLTNSNAYKQARSFLEVKELYIHLSYLLTYAIGRFKSLQDKCLGDMRTLGFGNDADCLENGQLAAAVDYVCYGQLDDVDLFNTGSNSFHNQVYEYRKSLHANLKEGEDGAKSPLPPIFSLGQGKSDDVDDEYDGEDSLLEEPKGLRGHWLEGGDDSPIPSNYNQENEENEEPDESYLDNDDDEGYNRGSARASYGDSLMQGTEESMKKNEESYVFDRKLTRLVSQYPSIWCTRHPDYGNFEVTRKQWRTIASHFDGNDHIKLRWKNIRKRFVRIEKRIAEGKRFNGHFDKAMAFLANRDLPEDQWVPVDCGEDDGDTYTRCNLDAIEHSLHLQGKDESVDQTKDYEKDMDDHTSLSFQPAVKPIDVEPLDMKIITFVKSNPVLWRKSMDPEADKIDEETRRTIWKQLQRNLTNVSLEDIRDRWQHLYEMYKTFRLKTIKCIEDRSNLELKYSKYLAKLYFLYKIDEDELRNENNGLFEDCFELEDDEEVVEHETEVRDSDEEPKNDGQTKLQDMPDDKEFLLQLVKLVRQYPAIWDTQHEDYNDIMVRDNYWQKINENLQDFKHKQASDDEDNEIEIVEPKTDLITLDSDDDDDEPPASTLVKPQMPPLAQIKTQPVYTKSQHCVDVKVKPTLVPITPPIKQALQKPPAGTPATAPQAEENLDLMSMAQSFLASMLEVDIQEGPLNSPGSDSSGQKKQPRKKLTNKPNPTLLKQKALMERERLEELKRSDQKLKMQCSVELKKAEEVYPYAKEMLEARAKEKLEVDETNKSEGDQEEVPTPMETDDPDQTKAELANEDDDEEEEEGISSTAQEKNNTTEENAANETAIEGKESTEKTSTKIVDENVETIQADIAEKEASVLTPHGKEDSVETVVEMADKSLERTEQYEDTKPQDGSNKNEKEINLTNAGDKSPREECSAVTTEDKTLNSIDEDVHSKSPGKEYADKTEDTSSKSLDENFHNKSLEKEYPGTTEDTSLKSLDENVHNKSIGKEYPDTIEDETLKSVEENVHSQLSRKEHMDITFKSLDENVHSNHIDENKTNEDKSPEKMELDENPPPVTTTNDTSINIDDKESSLAASGLDLNKIETNALELAEKVAAVDQNSEKALQSHEANSEEVSNREFRIVERQHSHNEIKNLDKSVGSTNDQDSTNATEQKSSSPQNCDVEHRTFNAAVASINNDETLLADAPISELTVANKLLPLVTDNCHNKEQIVDTASADLKETIASSRNGNV